MGKVHLLKIEDEDYTALRQHSLLVVPWGLQVPWQWGLQVPWRGAIASVHGATQFSHSTRQGKTRDKKKGNVSNVRILFLFAIISHILSGPSLTPLAAPFLFRWCD